MFSITRKTDYALLALTGLAVAQAQSVSTRELAARLNLPLPILRNILKDLGRAGLVASTRGAQGGYRLARPAEQISIAAVAEVIEGPIRFTRCCGPTADESAHAAHAAGGRRCPLEHSCLIRGSIQRVHAQLVAYLGQVTLADLAVNATPVMVGIEGQVGGRGRTGQRDVAPAVAGARGAMA